MSDKPEITPEVRAYFRALGRLPRRPIPPERRREIARLGGLANRGVKRHRRWFRRPADFKEE